MKQLLKINQKIEIALSGTEVFSKTVVQDLRRSTIYVSLPTKKGKAAIPQKGESIDGRFSNGNSLYTFTTTVLGLKIEDSVLMLMLAKPQSLTRHHRRDYFRCPGMVEMEFTSEKEDCPDEEANWVRTKTLDIGGGGIRFISSIKMEKGTKVRLKIFTGTGEDEEKNIIRLSGILVRAEPVSTISHGIIYSVIFTDLSETQRDRIINFTFNLVSKRTF